MVDAALVQVAREYDLGVPLEQDTLSGGSAATILLRTSRGAVVVKDGGDERALALYKRVEEALNARGVRQARLHVTMSGQLTASTGQAVFEFLPGWWAWRPAPAQASALMRYLVAYHRALRAVPVPSFVTEVHTPWQRADALDYLLHELPQVLETAQVSPLFARAADRTLTFLADHRTLLVARPTQLVHGDVGPGNILYTDEDVVALIDFTPYRESPLYALCVSFYWHYVYDNDGRPDIARIRDDLHAYATIAPFSAEDKHVFYPTFVKAAARILFGRFLFELEAGRQPSPTDKRAAIVNNILACRRKLAEAIADL